MSQKTPFSRPISLLFFLCFLIFSIFYLLTSFRNKQFQEGYESLGNSGNRGFATIKEFHTSERKGIKNYIYTYTTYDDSGRLTDIVEYVDLQTHKKLRIGDTIEIEKMSIEVLGKKNLIARIIGNSNPPPNENLLESLASYGIVFSIFILIKALILWRYEGKR